MSDPKFEKQLFGEHVIDNRRIKMTDALRYLLNDTEFKNLDIAVGYFYISGLLLLKEEVTDFINGRGGKLRILMGNETNGATVNILSNSKFSDYKAFMQDKAEKDASEITDKEFLYQVNQWLKESKLDVKVYTGTANYFHAKSYLFANKPDSYRGTAIVGSSNLSKAGLEGNTELNVLTQDSYSALHNWFLSLWNSQEEVSNFSPELIKISHVENYKHKPDKAEKQEYKPVSDTYYDFANLFARPYTKLDTNVDWVAGLYPHQRSGVVLIKEKLDTFNTAVLSDGVGLGKTRTAAGVIRLYLGQNPNYRVLVLADNKLKRQWKEELEAVGIPWGKYDYMSRQEMLKKPLDKLMARLYDLIVVDEAHLGFKNSETKAYRHLFKLHQSQPTIKGLMLTATPWNNTRQDVINIGSLFINIDAIPNNRDYKQYFLTSPAKVTKRVVNKLADDDDAFRQFWSDIFLQRTRKTYGGKGASFPQRSFPSVDIPYEPRKNALFGYNFEQISELELPYQGPYRYVGAREYIASQMQLQSQYKMLLLKRADSSWVAFVDSLEKIKNNLCHLKNSSLDRLELLMEGKNKKLFLDSYKQYLYLSYDIDNYEFKNNLTLFDLEINGVAPNENDDGDSDSSFDESVSDESKLSKKLYIDKLKDNISKITYAKARKAVSEMIGDCNHDLEIVEDLLKQTKEAYRTTDEKLNTIIKNVDKEINQNHKVILISQFTDTVDYYYKSLYAHYNKDEITVPMGMVVGAENEKYSSKINSVNSTKDAVLDRFSPRSKNKIDLIDNKELDLIVGSDSISTGQNLQDAVTLMNIDLPYNPMILEQRIGRIDRPRKDKKTAGQIYIYTFPIYESINSQLKMNVRLGQKLKGAMKDTQFDTVVLPQYAAYLKEIEKDRSKSSNAVENMVTDLEEKTLYHRDFAAEEHSEAYREANQRMYDLKVSHPQVMKNPLIKTYSFSRDEDIDVHSLIIFEILYKDANGASLGSDLFIANSDNGTLADIVDTEKILSTEIPKDVHGTATLSEEKAKEAIESAKKNLNQVKVQAIEHYNAQHEFVKENTKRLNDSTSIKAARALRVSAKKNPVVVSNTLREANMEPKDLVNICNYIETIDKDDELYELVREIAANADRFWLNFKEYAEYFSPDVIADAKRVGNEITHLDMRQADLKKSEIKILAGNIVIKK